MDDDVAMDDFLGWYDDPTSSQPTHDPGLAATCPVCKTQLSRPVRAVSLLRVGDNRSFFFRVHKACSEDDRRMWEIESDIVDGRDLSASPCTTGG